MELLPSNIPAKNSSNIKGKKQASTDDQIYHSDSNGPSTSKKMREDFVEISTTGTTSSDDRDVIMKET